MVTVNGKPVFFDDKTIENQMRKESIPDMIKLSREDDPKGRLLLFEELRRAKPNEDVIESLLKERPNRIKQRDASGQIPLHIACHNIHSIEGSIIVTLIETYPEGAYHADKYGNLPLHKCAIAPLMGKVGRPNLDNVMMVQEAYADGIKKKNKRGQLPLHLHISVPSRISSDLVDQFVEAYPQGCQVQDNLGQLPLHRLMNKKGNEALNIFETLMETYPAAVRAHDSHGMLPIHWAVARMNPIFDICLEMVNEFPHCVLQRDHQKKLPIDYLLCRGSERCGSTMYILNNAYETIKDRGDKVAIWWEELFLLDPPEIEKLKAPNCAPRPTPYTFGKHDWCLQELNHTERIMALIHFGKRLIKHEKINSKEEIPVYLLALKNEFGKRKAANVDCFGPSLTEIEVPENATYNWVKGKYYHWWKSKIEIPDWPIYNKTARAAFAAIMAMRKKETKDLQDGADLHGKLLKLKKKKEKKERKTASESPLGSPISMAKKNLLSPKK